MASSVSIDQLADDFIRRLPASDRRISIGSAHGTVDQSPDRMALDRLRALWFLSKGKAASMFGVTRHSYMTWEDAGISRERRIVLDTLNRVTNILCSCVADKLIPAIVRWRCEGFAGRSLIELAEEGRYDELLNAAAMIKAGSAGALASAYAMPKELVDLIAVIQEGDFVQARPSDAGTADNVARHPNFSFGVRYKQEFRNKMVELVRAGYRVSELAKISGCSDVIIRSWVRKASGSKNQ